MPVVIHHSFPSSTIVAVILANKAVEKRGGDSASFRSLGMDSDHRQFREYHRIRFVNFSNHKVQQRQNAAASNKTESKC